MAGQYRSTHKSTGGEIAATLRRHLDQAVADGRDPWAVAEQAGRLHGFDGAPLAYGNALRMIIAQGFAGMGRHDLARAMMRELVIDCAEIDARAGCDQ